MPNLNDILKLFRMSREKLLLLIILILLILLVNKSSLTNTISQFFPEIKNYLPTEQIAQNEPANTNSTTSNNAKVIHIADGDTVTIQLASGEKEIVRLLAVNTLEMESSDAREKCLAKMAKDFTTQALLNQKVEIITDPTQPKRDKYGRLLLYLKREGGLSEFNEQLMYTGLAKTYKASPPAQMWQKYEGIRVEMENQKKGIWDPKLCTGFTP